MGIRLPPAVGLTPLQKAYGDAVPYATIADALPGPRGNRWEPTAFLIGTLLIEAPPRGLRAGKGWGYSANSAATRFGSSCLAYAQSSSICTACRPRSP